MTKQTRTARPTSPQEVAPPAPAEPKTRRPRISRFIAESEDIGFIPEDIGFISVPEVEVTTHAAREEGCDDVAKGPDQQKG